MTARFGRRNASALLPETDAAALPGVASLSLAQAAAAADEAIAARDALGRSTHEVIRDLVLARLEPLETARASEAELTRTLEHVIADVANEHGVLLNSNEQKTVVHEVVNDIVGFGPLEHLLHEDDNTDILVNGAGEVYVERHGMLELTQVRFRSDAHVMHIAQRIAASVGRRVDEASPMLDARLADGSRVNVVFPPASVDRPCISIRKFSRRALGFDELLAHDSVSPKLAKFLEIATRCRLNIIVSGGTGSGKTTLLNAMSSFIDRRERVITVEDSAELKLQLPHVIRLESRPPNIEGEGEITERDLVRNALRMRPDRIIVGEVRGVEAFDMLQAMNTGHNGSMSTVHANSPRDALTRIENMVLMATQNLPSAAILSQIAGAIHLVVQVERMRDGARRVTDVTEILGFQEGTIVSSKLFTYVYEGEGPDGMLRGTYEASDLRPRFMPRIEYYGMADALMETLRP